MGGVVHHRLLAGSAMYKISPSLPFWVGSGLVILAALLVFLFIKEPEEFVQTDRYNIIGSLMQVLKDKDKAPCGFSSQFSSGSLDTLPSKPFLPSMPESLGLSEADGSRLLGHLSLLFVLFAIRQV